MEFKSMTFNRIISTLSLVCLFNTALQAETLLDIYRLAENNDPQFRIAAAELEAVKERIPQARSKLLPSVNLGAAAAKQWNGGNNSNATNSNYNLSLVQPLFHRDVKITYQQANVQVQLSEAEYQNTLQILIIQVAEAYFNVLSAQDNLGFLQATKKAIQRQLDQSQQRFDVGLIAITDVYESQAAYDLAVADEIAAQAALDTSYEKLRQLTGSYQKNLARLNAEQNLVRPDPDKVESWVAIALENSPILKAAEQGVEVANYEIKKQRAGHLPTLDLVGQHNYADSDSDGFSGGYTRSNSISLQFNLPLYLGGAIQSRTREAKIRHGKAQDLVEQQRRLVQRQTHQAYVNALASISRVKALKQAVVSTKAAYEATQTGFDVGTRTSVEVLNAQRDVFRARRDYARVRYEYVLNTLVLKQATGSLSSKDLEHLESWFQ